jgi:hypothetical protein
VFRLQPCVCHLALRQAARTPAENARAAALARFGHAPLTAGEKAVKRLRTMGSSGDDAIELSDDDDDEYGGGGGGSRSGGGGSEEGGLFAPMGALTDEESDAGEQEEEDVQVHNGPPGLCDCAICLP